MKAIEQYFPVVLFIMLYKVALTFESMDEILKYDHSNESYWPVLSNGIVNRYECFQLTLKNKILSYLCAFFAKILCTSIS